ncbi:MAG: hypothetical protein V1794_08290 [Candidatus Glassbacteria bacterium]
MSKLFKFFAVSLAIVLSAGHVFAISSSLNQLLTDEKIIMPDLAQRYPNAEAVIVLDKVEIDQSRSINPVYVSRHFAVKILKESAIEKFRTIRIPYYEDVKFDEFDAQTINDAQVVKVNDIPSRSVDLQGADKDFILPIGMANNVFALRPMETSTSATSTDLLKLTDSQVFHKKKEVAWRIREINFPEVRVGSVLEYSYKIEDKRVQIYDRFRFQREYPALKLRYILENMLMLRFSYQVNNFMSKPETVYEPRINNLEDHDNMRIRNGLRTVDTNRPESWQYFGHRLFDIAMDTVDAYPVDIAFMPSIHDVAPRVDMILMEIFNIWVVSDNDIRVRREPFSPSWNSVFRRITDKNLVDENRSRRSVQQIAEVIASASSPEDKVKAAIAWTREHIRDNGELKRWQGYFWGSEPMGPDDLLRQKVGNADDITHFLISALWFNNLQVFPAYTKSRESGKLLNNIPMETQFDRSLLALEVSRRRFQIYQPSLDIPMPADYVDYQYEGQRSYVNQSDKTDIAMETWDIAVADAEKNTSRIDCSFKLDTSGNLSGSIKQSVSGHVNADLRRALLGAGDSGREQAWLAMLSGSWEKLSLQGDFTVDDPNVVSEKLNASANVSITGVGKSTAEGIVLNGSILTDPYSPKLTGEDREFTIELPYTTDVQTSIEIEIPAGYAMPDSLPAPVEYKTRGLYYNRVLAKQGPNKLLVKRDFSMGLNELPINIYNRRLSKIFADILAADAIQVLLKKQ